MNPNGHPYRTLQQVDNKQSAVDKKKWIIVIEPSIFRAHDTYVLGPFGKVKAWIVAHVEIWRNPHAAAKVIKTNNNTRVLLGNEVLWPREGQ